MTARHVDRAYRPTAAFWWGTAQVFCLITAAAVLGVALAMVAAEWLLRGEFRVTGAAGAVGFLALFLCAVATVAHAMRVHAIDGPPHKGGQVIPNAGVFDPTGTVFDPNLARHHDLDPVDDEVRADAREHADEDDPFGVIGGAP